MLWWLFYFHIPHLPCIKLRGNESESGIKHQELHLIIDPSSPINYRIKMLLLPLHGCIVYFLFKQFLNILQIIIYERHCWIFLILSYENFLTKLFPCVWKPSHRTAAGCFDDLDYTRPTQSVENCNMDFQRTGQIDECLRILNLIKNWNIQKAIFQPTEISYDLETFSQEKERRKKREEFLSGWPFHHPRWQIPYLGNVTDTEGNREKKCIFVLVHC